MLAPAGGTSFVDLKGADDSKPSLEDRTVLSSKDCTNLLLSCRLIKASIVLLYTGWARAGVGFCNTSYVGVLSVAYLLGRIRRLPRYGVL